jgi:hypothetical protein
VFFLEEELHFEEIIFEEKGREGKGGSELI